MTSRAGSSARIATCQDASQVVQTELNDFQSHRNGCGDRDMPGRRRTDGV